MKPRQFKLSAAEITDLVPPMGACVATDAITVEGMKVGYMYREASDVEVDSGWRCFAVRNWNGLKVPMSLKK